ncbi:MAG: Lsm family RNA-binding protein [Desulfurococcales archaeon]|nr:Lsm family RNA-binding protein [Desulfurococcales archaeon]MCE4626660.1 Lsm family RNA-binding protein [Desulfurococcales archaeon]
MALVGEASRRFIARLNALLGKNVIVHTMKGKVYKGILYGFDQSTLSVVLTNVEEDGGTKHPLVFVTGHNLAEITVEESAIFDAKEFADFLVRHGGIALHQVRVYEDLNIVEVSRTVKVSKDGVEGAGPLAQKIYTLYREYLRKKGVGD